MRLLVTRKVATLGLVALLSAAALGAQESTLVRATASSVLPGPASNPGQYGPQKAFDRRPNTVWVEGKPDAGAGERLHVEFGSPVRIDQIEFEPGFFTEQWYAANNRVRELLVVTEDGRERSYRFEDRMVAQRKPLGLTTTGLSFEIRAVYPGNRWDDTCIARIAFFADGRELPLRVSSAATAGRDQELIGELIGATRNGSDREAQRLVAEIIDPDADYRFVNGEAEAFHWEEAAGTAIYTTGALAEAARAGSSTIVAALLARDANPDRGVLPATTSGNSSVLWPILEAGGNPNTIIGTGHDHSFLMNAPNAPTALAMLQHGADIHHVANGPAGYSVLHAAIDGSGGQRVPSEQRDLVRVLLANGADPNATHIYGTALSSAISDAELVRMLLSAGADPNRSIPNTSDNAVELALDRYEKDHPIVELLQAAAERPAATVTPAQFMLGELERAGFPMVLDFAYTQQALGPASTLGFSISLEPDGSVSGSGSENSATHNVQMTGGSWWIESGARPGNDELVIRLYFAGQGYGPQQGPLLMTHEMRYADQGELFDRFGIK